MLPNITPVVGFIFVSVNAANLTTKHRSNQVKTVLTKILNSETRITPKMCLFNHYRTLIANGETGYILLT